MAVYGKKDMVEERAAYREQRFCFVSLVLLGRESLASCSDASACEMNVNSSIYFVDGLHSVQSGEQGWEGRRMGS